MSYQYDVFWQEANTAPPLVMYVSKMNLHRKVHPHSVTGLATFGQGNASLFQTGRNSSDEAFSECR